MTVVDEKTLLDEWLNRVTWDVEPDGIPPLEPEPNDPDDETTSR